MRSIAQILDEHIRIAAALRPQLPQIQGMAERMIHCLQQGGRIYWLGNGGSAADAQHLAAELVGRFARWRPGLASIALTTDTSALTAISNDLGFEQVFARQVEALCRPPDLVIGISTSGNSPNVIRALETARHKALQTLGLSGRDGGRLQALADLCLVVPAEDTARIQEMHILIGHMLCELVETRLAEG